MSQLKVRSNDGTYGVVVLMDECIHTMRRRRWGFFFFVFFFCSGFTKETIEDCERAKRQSTGRYYPTCLADPRRSSLGSSVPTCPCNMYIHTCSRMPDHKPTPPTWPVPGGGRLVQRFHDGPNAPPHHLRPLAWSLHSPWLNSQHSNPALRSFAIDGPLRHL